MGLIIMDENLMRPDISEMKCTFDRITRFRSIKEMHNGKINKMISQQYSFDVAVIGAGHAGCEAALCRRPNGCKTIVTVINVDTIGAMSCNRAIGGLAKGTWFGKLMLLAGKWPETLTKHQFNSQAQHQQGPAVRSSGPRKTVFHRLRMKTILETQENLTIRQAVVDSIIVENCG